LSGYSSYTSELTVQAGDQRIIKTVLSPLPGKLKVLSTPPGARVYLNNQFKAETPLSAELPAGQYAIRMEARGYDPQELTNNVAIGQESVVEFNLIKSSGTILLTTEPPGISVYLDGETRGTTHSADLNLISDQLHIDFVPKGKRTLQLARPGYYDLTRTVDIQSNQTVILHEKLKLRPVPFVPNMVIRTGAGMENSYKGIVREQFENGTIKLEVEPGIFRTFTRPEIMSIEPLTNAFEP
jgi:hypothetical protein